MQKGDVVRPKEGRYITRNDTDISFLIEATVNSVNPGNPDHSILIVKEGSVKISGNTYRNNTHFYVNLKDFELTNVEQSYEIF